VNALVLDRPGEPGSLRIAELEIPEPGPGELLVRVHAVGLNPADYKLIRQGHPAWTYPFVPGLDVAGTVAGLGAGISGWKIGDRVYYHGDLSRPGGFADYAVVAAHVVAPIPVGVTFIDAAAVPCAGFTAYQALFRKLHIQPGESLLVHGGAGGVGGFAVQLARDTGAVVLTTASSRNFDYVRGLGADHAIDYNNEDVAARVMEITDGRGVDAVVDTVGRSSATNSLQMLAFNGAIACVVSLPDLSRIGSFSRGLSIHRIALGGAHLSGDRIAQEDLARMGREMGELIAAGRVDPMVGQIVTLQGIPEALDRLSRGGVRGKIVASISG